jgi:hypothetical protein
LGPCFPTALTDEAAFKRYLEAIQERLDNRYHQFEMQRDDPEFWIMWMDKSGGG